MRHQKHAKDIISALLAAESIMKGHWHLFPLSDRVQQPPSITGNLTSVRKPIFHEISVRLRDLLWLPKRIRHTDLPRPLLGAFLAQSVEQRLQQLCLDRTRDDNIGADGLQIDGQPAYKAFGCRADSRNICP